MSASLPANRAPIPSTPLVIAHRGASGHRPEHTLSGYELAIRMGADFVEPDLVPTRDGVLVARHENEISTTTDVALHPEFAARRTTKRIDGRTITGWFTEDFTLAELRTLRAVERVPRLRPDNTLHNGRYTVPTFEEILELVRRESRGRREIGVYPELKHPTYFASVGISTVEPLVRALAEAGLDRRGARVFVQCFEVSTLRELASRVQVPLVQLVGATGAPYDLPAMGDHSTFADLVTRQGLARVATYADAIGASKDVVLPRDIAGFLTEPSGVVGSAHEAGLQVHVWTMRDENQFLPADLRRGEDPAQPGDVAAEYDAFVEAGVDGFFVDHPDSALAALGAPSGPLPTWQWARPPERRAHSLDGGGLTPPASGSTPRCRR